MAAPVVATPLPRPQASTPSPVQRAAANRAQPQRFWNQASHRMETAQQIHGYQRPVPPGHQVSKTTQTTTREVTPQSRAPVSFINKSPAEIEATARQLVQAELGANRVPFQQQTALLGQEQQGALAGHAASYGQLASTVGGLQTSQAASAKTFENYAADNIAKAAQAAPGAAQTAERLGLKPGEQAPQSSRDQQEAARTLLSGIAQAGAAGTNARQQSEANFLTNTQAATAQANVEGAKNIEGVFGRQKQEVLNKEGQLVAKVGGTQASLAQKLFGEQEKLRIAAQGLGYKAAETASKVQERTEKGPATVLNAKSKAQDVINKAKGAEEGHLLTASKLEYDRATLAEKTRYDSANIGDKEGKLKELGRKLKIAEEKAGPGGTKVTAAQKGKYEKEMTTALNAFERGPNLEGKKAGRDYQRIRNELTAGENVKVGGKPKLVKGQAVNPVILNAMEQVFRYHYVNPETKKALAALGLPSEGLSNLLLRR